MNILLLLCILYVLQKSTHMASSNVPTNATTTQATCTNYKEAMTKQTHTPPQ